MNCKRCHQTMLVEDGLEPTDLCNDCVWDELDEVRAKTDLRLRALHILTNSGHGELSGEEFQIVQRALDK